MDDFTRQCLFQNLADFKAGRLSKDNYMNSLLSIFTNKAGGYINDQEYLVYPDCSNKVKIVVSDIDEDSGEE
jgi:hypothetical protein